MRSKTVIQVNNTVIQVQGTTLILALDLKVVKETVRKQKIVIGERLKLWQNACYKNSILIQKLLYQSKINIKNCHTSYTRNIKITVIQGLKIVIERRFLKTSKTHFYTKIIHTHLQNVQALLKIATAC